MSSHETRGSRRSLLGTAAALTRGPAELLDFVIPLWAGLVLGLDATAIGLLVAVELAVSCLARPLAGRVADRGDRRRVASVGALVSGLGAAGYALATSASSGFAFLAAIVGGLGGSLLWVAVRAIVSEEHVSRPSAFAGLLAAEETGAAVAFVVGLSALGAIGYSALFLLAGASCVIGAVVLAFLPPDAAGRARQPGPARAAARRIAPMLVAVVGSMAAEAGIGILLLIHMQKHFGLGVVETAWVFLPGAIALAVLPRPLHLVAVRVGRRRALLAAGVLSAAFAAGLALASSPLMIAILWVSSAVAWAVVVPVEQEAVAESVNGSAFGTAMGAYEAAALAGGAIGTALAGVAYEAGSWQLACVFFAIVALLGACAGPLALRAMGVADRPVPRGPEPGERP